MSSSHFIQGYLLRLLPLLPGGPRGALSAGWLGMLTPLGPYFVVTELRIEKKEKKKKAQSQSLPGSVGLMQVIPPHSSFSIQRIYENSKHPNWSRTGRFFLHIITTVTRSSPNPLFPWVYHFCAQLWDEDSDFTCWSSSTASLLKMYSSSQCSMFILIKKTSLQWNSCLPHKPFSL